MLGLVATVAAVKYAIGAGGCACVMWDEVRGCQFQIILRSTRNFAAQRLLLALPGSSLLSGQSQKLSFTCGGQGGNGADSQ